MMNVQSVGFSSGLATNWQGQDINKGLSVSEPAVNAYTFPNPHEEFAPKPKRRLLKLLVGAGLAAGAVYGGARYAKTLEAAEPGLKKTIIEGSEKLVEFVDSNAKKLYESAKSLINRGEKAADDAADAVVESTVKEAV